ncbi:MAG TPA: AMP-binding protein [Xanthobacteraceae bacterium]|nr:AMP-binding protein [Xanthobacteraceae bacterium]
MTGICNPIEGVVYCDEAEAESYTRSGAWSRHTVGTALRVSRQTYPDRPIFISDERTITYAQFDDETERLAAGLLDLGLAPGDRCIFQMGTTVETALALVACYKAGIIPVCSIPQHREVEIGQLARLSSARGYFVQADFSAFDLVGFARRMMTNQPGLHHLLVARGKNETVGTALELLIERAPIAYARERLQSVQLGPGDVLSFQLSGGTTGVPKIIPRFHGEYLGHSAGWMRRYGITSASRVIWSLPLLHNAGQLYALMPAVSDGVTTVLMPKVEIKHMFNLIERHRVTHGLSIGPIASQIMNYPDVAKHDLSSLRLFATMSRADALEAYLGVPCSNLFGITEGLVLGTGCDAPAEARHRTQGRSGCPEDEIKLLEPESEEPVKLGEAGELCFRGPSSLRGYHNAPEINKNAFTRDGFYRSGDIMTAHVIGGETYYTFEGRARDNINRGGEKIGCEEVEAFVSMHPSVADAKLVPMPDELYGERGCVFLMLRPNQPTPNVKELSAFLVGKGLAKFKCPERVEIVDEFPLTRVGKIDKPALRAMVAELLKKEQETGCVGRQPS